MNVPSQRLWPSRCDTSDADHPDDRRAIRATVGLLAGKRYSRACPPMPHLLVHEAKPAGARRESRLRLRVASESRPPWHPPAFLPPLVPPVLAGGPLLPVPITTHLQTSLLAPPEASLLPLETEAALRPTPRPPTAPPRKNTRVRHVRVVRSDVGRIPQPGGAEVTWRPPPGWMSRAWGRPFRVVRHCPLNSAAVSCDRSSGALAASSRPHPGPAWLRLPS